MFTIDETVLRVLMSCLLVGVCLLAAEDPSAPSGPAPAPDSTEQVGLIGFASVPVEGLPEGTTGGAGGEEVTVTTASELMRAVFDDKPRVVIVAGTIKLPRGMHEVGSNKTLLGADAGAQILGGGLRMRNVHNVIIRNLVFRGANDDAISITDRAHHVWVDHCDLAAAGDGLIDITHQASYVTVSWNRFSDHHKTMLIGNSDKFRNDVGFLKVTVHHNWFAGTRSRHPRVRFGQVHAFNNFYDHNGYGVASTMGAQVVVEANYFLAVPRPTLTRYGRSASGNLAARGNVYRRSGSAQTRGRVFRPASKYPYEPDKAADVPKLVRQGAGVGKL